MFKRDLISFRDKLCGSTTRIEHEILYHFFEFHNYFSENHRPTTFYPHGEYWECTEKNNTRKRDGYASRSEKARFELHVQERAPDLNEGLGEEEHERNFWKAKEI